MKFSSLILMTAAVFVLASCAGGDSAVKPSSFKTYSGQNFGISFGYPSEWKNLIEDTASVWVSSPDKADILYVLVNSGASLDQIAEKSLFTLTSGASKIDPENVKGTDQILLEDSFLKNCGADSGYSTARKFFAGKDSYSAQFIVMKKGTNQYILHMLTKSESLEQYGPVNARIIDSFKIAK
ncbi:MAG: hypothetical protein A2Y33_02845 [Spirochaetes bacterium GWF1_51_8]|nr:MAG: hypothetical protein A2Y33_02845 [Spirochaetes bacterium GWF1_51_8]